VVGDGQVVLSGIERNKIITDKEADSLEAVANTITSPVVENRITPFEAKGRIREELEPFFRSCSIVID